MSDLPTSTLDAALSEVAAWVAAVNEEQAIARCNELIASYPDAVRVYRARAEAHERAGDATRAIDDYTRVLEIVPTDFHAMIGLARCQLAVEQAREAMVNAQQALDYDPLNADALQLAKDADADEDADTTIDAVTGVGTVAGTVVGTGNGANAKGQVAIARNKFAAGMTNRALADLRRLNAASPDRTDLQAILAELLWRSGVKITTAEVCQAILDAQPDCLNAHVILYAIWSHIGNNDLADVHARAVERLDPDYRETHAWLGDQSPFVVRDVPARVEPPDAPDLDAGEQAPASEANGDEDRSAWVDELIAAAAPVSASASAGANVAQSADTDVEPEYSGEVAGTTPLEWTPAEPDGDAEDDVPEWLSNLRAQSTAPKKADGQRFSADLAEPQPRDVPLTPLEWAPDVNDEESAHTSAEVHDEVQDTDAQAAPLPPATAQPSTPIKVFSAEPAVEVAPVQDAPESTTATGNDETESARVTAEPATEGGLLPKKKGRKTKGRKTKPAGDELLTLARASVESAQFDEAAEYYSSLIASGKKLNVILADLQSVTQAHPDARRFHALLGDVYTRKGDVNAALMAYHQALAGS